MEWSKGECSVAPEPFSHSGRGSRPEWGPAHEGSLEGPQYPVL